MTNREKTVSQRHDGREAGRGGRHQGRLAAEMPKLLVTGSSYCRREVLVTSPLELILAQQRAVLIGCSSASPETSSSSSSSSSSA